MLVLAHLRNGGTYARLAAGFGSGVATVYRYLREAVTLLVTLGRGLTTAVWALACTHSNVALLDGTVVRINRIRTHDRLSYSGQHRHHGVNLQGLTGPHGQLIWIFDGLPGSTHDLTATRHHMILTVVAAAELYLYADKGYVGADGTTLLTPYKGRNLADSYRQANRCHAAIRANAERGFTVLKSWTVFDRFRGCLRRVGTYARAVLTLEHNSQ